LLEAVKAAASAYPDQRIALWFMDEARFGQKGRTTHCWWMKGQRPPGIADNRFESAYIFAAVQPSTGEDFALVLPWVSSAAMSTFLAGFAEIVPADTHVVMVLDQAGWHGAKDLVVPDGLTLVPLPSYSPELNPVERIWLYLRERYLSHRLLADYEAVVDACCQAWNALTAEKGRIQSLTSYPYLDGVTS
jgi:hypothetical protein